MADDYPEDTGQTLREWLDEWAAMEGARLAKALRDFPAWLAARDTSKWVARTREQYEMMWSPFRGGIDRKPTK